MTSEDERAQDICFLQHPANPIPHEHEIRDITYAATADLTTAVALPANHTLVRHDNEDLVQFSDELFTAPSVLVLDTDGDQIVSAHLPLLAGKIIESFELDGSTVEMPNAAKSLGMQNCMFADSAITASVMLVPFFLHSIELLPTQRPVCLLPLCCMIEQ